MKKKIICVDDEVLSLLSLVLVLRHQFPLFHIEMAISAEEVLKSLKEESYNLLISDFMMPKMDGGQLLGIVHEKWPEVGTILLTGYPKNGKELDEIRKGKVNKIITKPWEKEDLFSCIKELMGN